VKIFTKILLKSSYKTLLSAQKKQAFDMRMYVHGWLLSYQHYNK